MDQVRHAMERGRILFTLVGEFGRPTLIRTLRGALDLQGLSLTQDGLEFHLHYLGAQGYLRLVLARDMPGWRQDRENPVAGCVIVMVGLTPLGLQLVDGTAPEDPQVRF